MLDSPLICPMPTLHLLGCPWGVTYVVLTKSENPWISANNTNGFSSTLSSNGSNNPASWGYVLQGGTPNKYFKFKAHDGYVYPVKQFNSSGGTVIDVYASFVQHNGSPRNEYWVQYV